MNQKCVICKTADADSKHHLIPRCKGGKEVIRICSICHNKINSEFTNKELEKKYNTLDKLKNAPTMAEYIEWRKAHPNFNGTFRMSNNRKRKGNIYK